MSAPFYIIISLAVAIIGGTIGGFIGINVAVQRVETEFLKFNKRIGALEDERQELRIKYNALAGVYRQLVEWSDLITGILDKIGYGYPEPPHRNGTAAD